LALEFLANSVETVALMIQLRDKFAKNLEEVLIV